MSETETLQAGFYSVVAIAVALFFLPMIIAFARGHQYRWVIFLLNLFGWTGVLWLVALVWSAWPAQTSLRDPVLVDTSGVGYRDRREPIALPADEVRRPSVPARSEPRFVSDMAPVARSPHQHKLDLIARLAELRDAGLITDAEFQTKKNEILKSIG